jgi:hypothetical protein
MTVSSRLKHENYSLFDGESVQGKICNIPLFLLNLIRVDCASFHEHHDFLRKLHQEIIFENPNVCTKSPSLSNAQSISNFQSQPT